MIGIASNFVYSIPATDGSLSRLEGPNLVFAGTNAASGTVKAVVFAAGMYSDRYFEMSSFEHVFEQF
jgi:hypothetical protein